MNDASGAEVPLTARATRLKQQANEIRFSAMTMTNHSGLGIRAVIFLRRTFLPRSFLGECFR